LGAGRQEVGHGFLAVVAACAARAAPRTAPRRAGLPARCGSSLQRNDAGVWLCEYPGLSFQRSPVCACSLVSSLLLSGATMSQQSSLTQSAHSVRQVLTAYTGLLPREDFAATVRLVEVYVFRRAICAIPTNSLNKTFSTFTKSLKKQDYLESIQAHLLGLPSYRRFPSDDEFRRDLQSRDLYNFPRRSYWLRRLENHDRKERVQVDEYTIEHILPQNENLSTAWKLSLGQEWERVRETWLHTLGNLTLTGYNSEYSDRPFAEERDMSGGFKESPLKLNAGLGQLDQWNEDTI